MTLQDKVEMLVQIRAEVNTKSQLLEEAKVRRDNLQAEIMQDMKETGFDSIRHGNTSVTIARKKTLTIIDEGQFVSFLKEKGLGKEYVAERPNEYAKNYLNEAAKEGLEIPGTEPKETEYISVRNKEEKQAN